MQRSILIGAVFVVLGVLGVACGEPRRDGARSVVESRSPSARPEIVEALRQDQAAPRHLADGGGLVRLVRQPDSVVISRPGTWAFEYEAGPLGIAEDGWLFFQAPPFWGWSTPQVLATDGLGYTTVTTGSDGVTLDSTTVDQQLLAIQVRGRDLAAGETIEIEYGSGPAGALADRYAESRSCFFFSVDGDGDGVRSLLDSFPCIEVDPGPAAHLRLTLPSTAEPGGAVDLVVAVLDAVGNRASNWVGEVQIYGVENWTLSEALSFQPSDAGARRVEIQSPSTGIWQVAGNTANGIEGISNPMVVEPGAGRVLWADLHGHSGLSDGTGTPKDYFRFARDVAGLDIVALTDHDHWGIQPLAIHPELWEEIRRETELFHRPEEFVTLLGYEWTSWIHGHRHVLYFTDQGQILSSIDPGFESPLQLWDALRGREVLTFAHHSAGGPVATNWEIPPDPDLEPITEVVSVHGSSEALDSPAAIYSPVIGNFVRDVLDRGYTLGFVGSGDGHDGHPGLSHLNAASGGLAAILSEELTRNGVLEAMRSRRVYATNGPRILLQVTLDEQLMGSILDTESFNLRTAGERAVQVRVVAPKTVEMIEIIRSGEITERIACGAPRCSGSVVVDEVIPGEYLYLRVLQTDGGAAWSSPFFFR